PLTSQQLARLARVSERDEYVVEIGGTISKETALSVLDAFNVFTGSKVSLQSIKITIVDAEHREPMPRFALFGDAEGGLTWRG
ncbi:MAG TPA: hypothetical protein VFB12_16680, partial [Ktedonobacteraceae bacterium]|nr:hypothetical protein [Ktedonobacteraceae bacterium]